MMQGNDRLRIPLKYQKMSVSELEKKKLKAMQKLKRKPKASEKTLAAPIGKNSIMFNV